MTKLSALPSVFRRPASLRALFFSALVPVFLLGVAAPRAHAETTSDPASSDIAAQTEEFARQKSELLARLKELQGKVEEAGRTVGEKANEPEVARRTIEEMRAVLSPLLAAVADNGEISRLGAKALKNAIDKKASLERDQRFAPQDRQKLIDAWAKRVKATSDAVAELEKARMTLLKAMISLQTKEDLIAEWAALRAQDEVIAIVKQLAQSFDDTSVNIHNFIALLESPSS